jgi:hypothetical protein
MLTVELREWDGARGGRGGRRARAGSAAADVRLSGNVIRPDADLTEGLSVLEAALGVR